MVMANMATQMPLREASAAREERTGPATGEYVVDAIFTLFSKKLISSVKRVVNQ
jgi:hypothetical protein